VPGEGGAWVVTLFQDLSVQCFDGHPIRPEDGALIYRGKAGEAEKLGVRISVDNDVFKYSAVALAREQIPIDRHPCSEMPGRVPSIDPSMGVDHLVKKISHFQLLFRAIEKPFEDLGANDNFVSVCMSQIPNCSSTAQPAR
jgi:hypothetical protein